MCTSIVMRLYLGCFLLFLAGCQPITATPDSATQEQSSASVIETKIFTRTGILVTLPVTTTDTRITEWELDGPFAPSRTSHEPGKRGIDVHATISGTVPNEAVVTNAVVIPNVVSDWEIDSDAEGTVATIATSDVQQLVQEYLQSHYTSLGAEIQLLHHVKYLNLRISKLRGVVIPYQSYWETLEILVFFADQSFYIVLDGQIAAGRLAPAPEAYRDMEPQYHQALDIYSKQLATKILYFLQQELEK